MELHRRPKRHPVLGELCERRTGNLDCARVNAQAGMERLENSFFCRPDAGDETITLCARRGVYMRLFGHGKIVLDECAVARLDPFQINPEWVVIRRTQCPSVTMTDRKMTGQGLSIEFDKRRMAGVIQDFQCRARHRSMSLLEQHRLQQPFCRPTSEQPITAPFLDTERIVPDLLRLAQEQFGWFVDFMTGFKQPLNHFLPPRRYRVTVPGRATV